MAPLDPRASPFVPSASTAPLGPSQFFGVPGTPFVGPASPTLCSSGLSPASQTVLAEELAAFGRREARHMRRQSEQQWGDRVLAQQPLYMYRPQTVEDGHHYQQLQAQYQAQYQPYEQTWILSSNRIEAQQLQQYYGIHELPNRNNESEQLYQDYVDIQHSSQTAAPQPKSAELLRQFSERGMEPTIYHAPPQPAQSPQMTRKQNRQMEGHAPTYEVSMKMQAYDPEEMVQAQQSDDTYRGATMPQYRASNGQQPVYVPTDASWQYQQYEPPDYVRTQAHPVKVIIQGLASQQEQSHKQQTGRQRAVFSHPPIYVHKRSLSADPGYEGYSITTERNVIRPDRVFAHVAGSQIPARGPRVRLPLGESSLAHSRSHDGGTQLCTSDLTPTRRCTDDGCNSEKLSDEECNLSKGIQQYDRCQYLTIRAENGYANDGRCRHQQREFCDPNHWNSNYSCEPEEIEAGRHLGAMRKERMESRPDRGLYDPVLFQRRQQESSAEFLPIKNTISGPPSRAENPHTATTAVTDVSSSSVPNVTMSSSRCVVSKPTRRPTVEDLSFAPAATSPVRTYTFPYAPATSSGQPINLPGPADNPLSFISERVALGEHVPHDTFDPHKLEIQSVVSQMKADARAAAARGRGEITYMDRGKYWVEKKNAGKKAWEMEGWKVGSGDDERLKKAEEHSHGRR